MRRVDPRIFRVRVASSGVSQLAEILERLDAACVVVVATDLVSKGRLACMSSYRLGELRMCDTGLIEKAAEAATLDAGSNLF
jgi:2-phospho-L-lactate transferase/gluconeogenesis factor (CofD/UPF0052 family)